MYLSRLLPLFLALCMLITGVAGCSMNNGARTIPDAGESAAGSKESTLPNDAPADDQSTVDSEEADLVRLIIEVGEDRVTAVLNDSETARDFMSLLPLTLKMSDYNATEKVADLPRELSLEGAPNSYDPEAGDICTYAPWGNFVVFYKNFGNTNGLVPLAHIESGLEHFTEQSGEFDIIINIEK